MKKNPETPTASSRLVTMRVEEPSLPGPVLLMLGQGILTCLGITVVPKVRNLSPGLTVVILLPIVVDGQNRIFRRAPRMVAVSARSRAGLTTCASSVNETPGPIAML